MKQKLINLIKRIITGSILGMIFFLVFFKVPPMYFSALLVLILCQIIIVEWKALFDFRSAAFWIIMPIYPILPFLFMISMNESIVYRELLFFLIVMVSAHDTGSYIVGTLFGKKKIAKTISQGKTWEGFVGGYASACISLGFILYEKNYACSTSLLLIFTLIVCFLALCGDLFESWLKRQAHVKDSGHILPGHGGFLDRFDGIMFAAVFFFIFKNQIVHLLGIQ